MLQKVFLQKTSYTDKADSSLPKPRVINADVLKVAAIFAVVYIHGNHIIPFNQSTYSEPIVSLMRFCVPIFIILWAYFMDKSLLRRADKKEYLTTRFYKLLVPFVIWSVVYFIILVNFKDLTFSRFLTKHWLGRGWSGQYYFLILFQLIPVYRLLSGAGYYYKKYSVAILALSALFFVVMAYSDLFAINFIGKIGYVFFLYWIPYVIVGIIYSRQEPYKRLSMSTTFIVGFVSLFIISLEPYFLSYRKEAIYLTPIVFVGSVLFFYSVMNANFQLIQANDKVAGAIHYVANNTLGVFCLNPLVILIILPWTSQINNKSEFWGSSIAIPLLSTVLILTLCLLITQVLKRLKLGVLVAN